MLAFVFHLVVAWLVASMPVRRGKSSSDLGAHHHQPQHQQQQLTAMWGGLRGFADAYDASAHDADANGPTDGAYGHAGFWSVALTVIFLSSWLQWVRS